MQHVLMVDKGQIQAQKSQLYIYMNTAKAITTDSSFVSIRKAESALNKAKGMFETLNALDLLDSFSVVQEDIDRTEAKIRDILDQKRMKDMIRRQ
jgi:conjugal transfer/entry exclusion protein